MSNQQPLPRLLAAAGLLTTASALSLPLAAQTTVAPASIPAPAPSAAQTPATVSTITAVPEVTVVGEALADPQSKPVSASFLSMDDVANFRVRELQDIVRLTPNSSATDSGSRSFGDVYSVRGLTNTVFFGAPATTIYVDDVPFGETFTYAQPLSAVNSVEVLRGPQPTVVGRNTYGGLINIRSLKPTNELQGDFSYAYGSYESHDFDGWLMGPLVKDTLFFRVGGQFDSREGYLWNPDTKDHVDDQEHWGVNAGLFWKPAEGWEISLTAGYDEYHDGAPRLTSLDRKNFYEVRSDVVGEQHRVVDNQALRVAYENEDWKFLSVTSRRNWDLDPYITDLDFTPDPFGSSVIKQDQEIWSQEFRFTSNDPKDPFQWNVGLYGSTGTIHGYGLRNIFTQQQTLTVTDISSQIPVPLPTPVNLTSLSNSDIAIQQITRHTIQENAFAFYAGSSWSGWDPVTLHAGVRVDWVHRELDRDKDREINARTNTTFQPVPTIQIPTPYPGIFFPLDIPTPEPLLTKTKIKERSAHQNFDDTWVHVTPTVGFDVKLGYHALLYAKTTYAFKPGGFSAYVDDPQYAAFEEERAWSTEAGLKTQWLDGKATANFAAFYNSIENYQVERSINVTDYAVFNADEAETYGVEFESRVALLPILDLSGSVGWTHARLTSYKDPVTGRSLDGNTPPFVPEFDAAVALDFHLEAGLFAWVEYLALGNTKYDDFNREEFQQDSFGLLNAAVGWRARNWSISLYGTNLAGEEYYTTMNTDVRTGAPGAPREFGVRVGVRF